MSFDMDEDILQDFLVEAGEILELLQEQLVELENNPDDANLLNAIFRGFHTVKGGAGFLSLTELVDACHGAENVFDILRTGKRRVTPELMDVILQSLDSINAMFVEVQNRQPLTPASAAILDALHYYSEPETAGSPPPAVAKATPAKPEPAPAPEVQASAADGNIDDITEEEFEQMMDELHGKNKGPAVTSAPTTATAPSVDAGDDITDDEFEAILDQLHGKGSFIPDTAAKQSAPAEPAAKAKADDEIDDAEFEFDQSPTQVPVAASFAVNPGVPVDHYLEAVRITAEAVRENKLAKAVIARDIFVTCNQSFDVRAILRELTDCVAEELDYLHESKVQRKFAVGFDGHPDYFIPHVLAAAENVIVTEWVEGKSLARLIESGTQEERDHFGKMYLRFLLSGPSHVGLLHADPHPGNFLIDKEANLIAIDFGCMKEVPDDFYVPYFDLAKKENINNPVFFEEKLYELEILKPEDTKEEKIFFSKLFHEMLSLFTQPFHNETFDFSDETFFGKIAELGERYSKSTELRNMNGNRGSKHFIYINRTFFGLYNLMHDLKATKVKINNFIQY